MKKEIWQKIVKNTPRSAEALQHALQIYCDGFFVLKFCHFLEEKYPEKFARQPLPGNDPVILAARLRAMRQFVRENFK